jgi:GNAT superfamily N-acetyltransferase
MNNEGLMKIECRPMQVSDYGVVECSHWESAEQVCQYMEKQGIASMLAFSGSEFLGQLYLQEYDPEFKDPGGWFGERPWADFHPAQPLDVEGRLLTLGCDHVKGEFLGQGVGTALLKAVIEWFEHQSRYDGLVTYAPQPGSKKLLAAAGQLPHTVYRRLGFREIKEVRDPVWMEGVTQEEYPDATEEEPGLMRVMLLTRE